MNDIKSSFLNITKNLSKTGSELMKGTKLNMELSTEEDNLKKLYIDIGKKVHEIYTYGGSLGQFFDEKYAELLEAQNKVDLLKNQIDELKGVKVCPKCGKSAERKADFCPVCGQRFGGSSLEADLQEEMSIPSSVQEPPVHTNAVKKCSACGAENQTSNRFCLSCGRVI